MTLVISKGITLRKGWQPMDPDAAAYITAVETADGQALEEKTKIAIDNFVLGCKADGIWSAIKASCILAGARTLAGALVPLAGTAPTSFNFVDNDYNRKTGLVGDRSTKYLDSSRNNNADPQNNQHLSVYISTATTAPSGENPIYIGAGQSQAGSTHVGRLANNGAIYNRSRNSATAIGSAGDSIGLLALSRSASGEFSTQQNKRTVLFTQESQAPFNSNIVVFATSGPSRPSDARLAFYSIGESLNLALLDARVTDLINAIAAAIP